MKELDDATLYRYACAQTVACEQDYITVVIDRTHPQEADAWWALGHEARLEDPRVCATGGQVLLSQEVGDERGITFSSDNTAAALVPTSVTVPAGATTVTFEVMTYTVGGSTAVTLTATYNGTNKTATLTVNP